MHDKEVSSIMDLCRQNLAWCVENGMAVKCRKEWEWLSCSNMEEGVAVVAVHKVKQGVVADGGRYWRCGEPQQ